MSAAWGSAGDASRVCRVGRPGHVCVRGAMRHTYCGDLVCFAERRTCREHAGRQRDEESSQAQQRTSGPHHRRVGTRPGMALRTTSPNT